MTITAVEMALARIKTTEPDSPLAVFRCNETGFVDVTFARTVMIQQRISLGDPRYVGSFHKQLPMAQVEKTLAQAAGIDYESPKPMSETRCTRAGTPRTIGRMRART